MTGSTGRPKNYLIYLAKWLWRREDFLSYKIDQKLHKRPAERDRYRGPTFWGTRKGALVVGVAVLLLEAIILAIGARLGAAYVPTTITEYAKVLWQVHAGLLGVAFVVLVLLIKVLGGRGQLSRDLFGIYVERSYILTLAFLGISTMGGMGTVVFADAYGLVSESAVNIATVYNSGLLLINLMAIGLVYERVVRFIAPGHGILLIKESLAHALQQTIDEQVRHGLGEAILNQACIELGHKYQPFSNSREKVMPVEYPLEGRGVVEVFDVDLKKLRCLSEDLSADQEPNVWIKASIGTTLSSQSAEVGYIIPQADSRHTQWLINSYVVRSPAKRNRWERARRDLRRRIRRAIMERQPMEVEELLDVYVSTMETYAAEVNRYDQRYLGFAFEGRLFRWTPDEDLYRDIMEVAEEAINADSRRLVRDLVYLPRRIMRTTHERENVDAFRRYARAYESFYIRAHRLPSDSQARSFILDRCWRHLKEYGDRFEYRYIDRFSTLDDTLRISDHIPYAVVVLEVFNNLLKQAIAQRDHESFQRFGEVVEKGLFTNAAPVERRIRHERYSLERNLKEADEGNRQEIDDQIQSFRRAEEGLERLEQTKKLTWFGIQAWILDLYIRERISDDLRNEFFQASTFHFDDLEELFEVYMEARTDKTQKRFRWGRWDEQRHDVSPVQIKARAVTTTKWLRQFYVVKGLQLIEPSTDITLPAPEDIQRETEALQKICKEIQDDGHPLESYDNIDDRIGAFLNIHEDAAERAREAQSRKLIKAELEQECRQAFNQAVVASWSDHSIDRLVGPYIPSEEISGNNSIDGTNWLGISEVVPKEFFVYGARTMQASTLGQQLGQALARGERQQIFKTLAESLPRTTGRTNRLADVIEKGVKKLRQRNGDPDFLLVGAVNFRLSLIKDDRFVPEWKEEAPISDHPAYEGSFSGIPLFKIPSDDPTIIVADLDQVISIKRAPGKDGEPIHVSLEKIDQEKAQEILKNSPGLYSSLSSDSEKKLSEEEAIYELRQRVSIEVSEKIQFRVKDKTAGIVIEVGEESDSD